MKNISLRTNRIYLTTLATAICCLFSSTAISQTRSSIWLGARVNQSFQLGQLNANLGQLNANLGQIRGTVFVVSNTNDSGPGSLRQAIAEANLTVGHDTITFDIAGLSPSGQLSPIYPFSPSGMVIALTSGELRITDSVTINGPGASLLAISGNHNSRVFNIISPRNRIFVNLNGTTISNAKLLESLGVRAMGGGIDASNCVLNIYRTALTDNEAVVGGGVYLENGILNIAESNIRGNSADGNGGGVATGPLSETYITNSLISNNSAFTGSGVSTQDELTFINSTVTENASNPAGSAVSAIRSFYIDEFTYVPLEALPRLSATPVEMYLINSTVSHNTGKGAGGVDHTGASYASTHSGVANIFSTMYLGNSIVANNNSATGADIAGPVISFGTNLVSMGPGEGGLYLINGVDGDLVGTPENPIDPKLGPLQDNGGANLTRALLAGSPAINRANNCVALTVDNGSCMLFPLTTDQRLTEGLSRLVAGRVDLGAFESHFTDQPTDREQCKQGGWRNFNNPRPFNNQGDCIQFVNTGH